MPDLTTILHHLQRQLVPALDAELWPRSALDRQLHLPPQPRPLDPPLRLVRQWGSTRVAHLTGPRFHRPAWLSVPHHRRASRMRARPARACGNSVAGTAPAPPGKLARRQAALGHRGRGLPGQRGADPRQRAGFAGGHPAGAAHAAARDRALRPDGPRMPRRKATPLAGAGGRCPSLIRTRVAGTAAAGPGAGAAVQGAQRGGAGQPPVAGALWRALGAGARRGPSAESTAVWAGGVDGHGVVCAVGWKGAKRTASGRRP